MLHNLSIVKELFKQGHWGGIHAVYNIYNATRITEFRQFAADQDVSVLWQNLFQPDYLDPFLHCQAVAELAAKEIEQFYSTDLVNDGERVFFNQALKNYQSVTDSREELTKKFKQHITDIETQYHADKAGEFARLWPEIYKLL